MDFQTIYSLGDLVAVTEDQTPALAYFSHQHCNVCKVLKPKVRELVETHFPRIGLYYVNTREQPEAAGQFSVFAVPTVLVFFEGKEYIREGRYMNLDRFFERLQKLYSIHFG